MEIYNENIYDLLSEVQESLRIRMSEGDGPNYVDGLTECDVTSMDDVTRVLEEGDKNRSGAY